MATIKEYLRYYKGLSFKECCFNINDVLLFTELSYIDWHNIVSESNDKISLRDAFDKYQKTKDVYLSTFMKKNIQNVKDIYTSTRYKDIYLSNYREYVDDEKQFGAITIHFDDKIFVSYKGTNGTVVGWKEDFTLGYEFPIISQVYAIDYLNEVAKEFDNKIFVGGHSKGGNLAMAAAGGTSVDVFNRIVAIYNLDGPGFREKDLGNINKIISKLQIYIPEDSVIGMLLYSTNNKRIVKSSTNGIMQHDINTWECFGQFLVKGKLSNISVKIDKRIKEWNKNYTDRELKDMIISLFNVLEVNGIRSFREFKRLKLNQILGIINEINDIDDDTKKLYSETIRDLIWINNKK